MVLLKSLSEKRRHWTHSGLKLKRKEKSAHCSSLYMHLLAHPAESEFKLHNFHSAVTPWVRRVYCSGHIERYSRQPKTEKNTSEKQRRTHQK